MSLKWPPKDPDEKLGYSVDWSRFLGADTISSVAWFITDADGTKVAVDAGNTVNGLKFVITCQITFGTDSLVSERKIQLPIREK